MKKEWYVVNTVSGYEYKVKEKLEMRINSMDLQENIFRVIVPEQKEIEYKNGVKKEKIKKMFPGYVMIHMIMNDDTWYVVRNTRGVTGFVGPGSKPVPLTDEEMVNLGITGGEEKVELDLEEGADMVIIKPSLAYLDLISKTYENTLVPVVAYNVSAEYSMVKAAAQNGWIDEKTIVLEIMNAFKRAGAKMVITYHAIDLGNWLKENR